jgi:hypothetical protein
MQKCFKCGVTPQMGIIDFGTPKSILCLGCQDEVETELNRELEEEAEATA